MNELGIFAMMETGMLDVENPSAFFLSRGESSAPGSQVMAIWEEPALYLVEAQALVDDPYRQPRRIAVGLKVSDWRCYLQFSIAMAVCNLGSRLSQRGGWRASRNQF